MVTRGAVASAALNHIIRNRMIMMQYMIHDIVIIAHTRAPSPIRTHALYYVRAAISMQANVKSPATGVGWF